MTHPFYAVLLLLLLIAVLGALRAEGKVIDGGPQPLSEMSSIGESLRNAGPRPLHILYVHGMEALGSGDSHAFQKGICELMKGCTLSGDPVPVNREYADRGEFQIGAEPPSIEYMRKAVWLSKDEWSASAPFVDHYVLKRSDGGPVVVDEINWWPLVFPLKCRNTIPGEAHLAGPDAKLLDLCSTKTEEDQPNHPGRFKSYQWLNQDDAAKLKAMPRKGAWANRWLKNNIMDWGVSDAFIAVGSMRNILREGMRQLFVKSARFSAQSSAAHDWAQQLANPQGIDREFIVVSHSLGSYLVFSTLNLDDETVVPQNVPAEAQSAVARKAEEDDAAKYILERTSLVYFFANQVPLLELATMEVPATAEAAPTAASAQPKPAEALSKKIVKWKNLRQNFKQKRDVAEATPVPPPQVIAWSDPSDLLSWYVPGIDDLKVDNVYVRNSWWHWLIANPASAHGNYASNKSVLRVMMRP
jgi:hypothetical protein